jgi:uncharacterized protein
MDNQINSGYWEKEGRNPLIIAFITVLLIGAIYFITGSLIANFYLFSDILINHMSFKGNYFDRMVEIYGRYKFPILAVTSLCEFVFFLFGTIFVFKKWHNLGIKKYFCFDKIDILGIVLSVSGIILLLPMADLTSRFFFYFFPEMKKLTETGNALFVSKNIYELLLLIFLIGITPAICEEFIFRGYFQRTLQRKLKEPFHYMISGFVFALFHQNVFGILTLTIVGIYLGFIFYRFASIYVSMAAHFTYNTIIVLSVNTGFFDIFLNEKKEIGYNVIIISTVLFLTVLAIIFIITRKRTKRIN